MQNLNSKQTFIGISLSNGGNAETGIAIIDKQKNILRIDKVINIKHLKFALENISGIKNAIICVDLPSYSEFIDRKWRLNAKNTEPLKMNNQTFKVNDWTERFSDRGSDMCKKLTDEGLTIFRYLCPYTKNILHLDNLYKSRSPQDCRALQLALEESLGIQGITNNLIALSGINALIGAYTAWSITQGDEKYKEIGEFNNLPIYTAI